MAGASLGTFTALHPPELDPYAVRVPAEADVDALGEYMDNGVLRLGLTTSTDSERRAI
jgi:hypothetical protein